MNVLPLYGYWHVTTEGDCEGRSIRDLGFHKGCLNDIAFALADKQYYSLQFTPINPVELQHAPAKASRVTVSLGASFSGTWSTSAKERVEYFKSMMIGQNVAVVPSTNFASVDLVAGLSTTEQLMAEQQIIRNKALSKLTEEDKKALGL